MEPNLCTPRWAVFLTVTQFQVVHAGKITSHIVSTVIGTLHRLICCQTEALFQLAKIDVSICGLREYSDFATVGVLFERKPLNNLPALAK
jgi:hypothetical protein